MAYSELIKSFSRIRDYMREFFVFGFKSRDEYSLKSARSYDNERRRIESWLGDYMSFRQTESGKNVFLSVDSRDMEQNPLFQAFLAKSFTDRDIVLYFYVMDILADGKTFTVPELMEEMEERYLQRLERDQAFDVSTLRKKMKEFEELGIVTGEKSGNKVRYRRTDAAAGELVETGESSGLREAVAFFTEESPLGVPGSFLLNRDGSGDSSIEMSHKHHYILDVLDSEVLLELAAAMREKKAVTLDIVSRRGKAGTLRFCPLRVYISTQQGRWHIYGYNYDREKFDVLRIDGIQSVRQEAVEEAYDELLACFEVYRRHLWGVSGRGFGRTIHLEMDVYVGEGENFIVERLNREKRCGSVLQVDDHTWRYAADVTDTQEMLPWIRTFTGRILRLVSDNGELEEKFYRDMGEMRRMYGEAFLLDTGTEKGGAEDAVS